MTGGGASVGGGAGVLGRPGKEGDAYQNRRRLLMLKVAMAWEGAHGVVGDSSPEFANVSATVSRRRWRGSSSR